MSCYDDYGLKWHFYDSEKSQKKKIVIPKWEDFELIRKRDISKWFKILSNVLEHLELILEHNLYHFQTCLKMAQEGHQRSSLVI